MIAPPMAVRRWFQLRSTRLFFINIGTCCVLYSLGDLIQQRIEGKKRNDWRRTARMATMGLVCMGPMNHHFYVYLDKILPGASARIVAKKVAADMLVIAPIADCSFFTGMCLLEGRNFSAIIEEIRLKFWPTYKMDCTIWPAAQVINFFFVPTRFRVAYVNVVTLIWTVFLSYMKHKEMVRQAAAV